MINKLAFGFVDAVGEWGNIIFISNVKSILSI